MVVDALETAGVATVVVGNQRVPLQGLPRVVLVRHARGRNFGEPGDTDEQRRIAAAAIDLLRDAAEPAIVDLGSTANVP